MIEVLVQELSDDLLDCIVYTQAICTHTLYIVHVYTGMGGETYIYMYVCIHSVHWGDWRHRKSPSEHVLHTKIEF